MRLLSRLCCTLAVGSLLFGATLFADDPPADEAAVKRTEELLAKCAADKTDASASHTLGVYDKDDKLMGYMLIELKKNDAGYDYALSYKLNLANGAQTAKITSSQTGKLDSNLALVSCKGERSMDGAPESFTCEAKDGKIHWTRKGAEGEKTVDIDHVDSIDGIEMLASRVWIGLPAGVVHRLHNLDNDDGTIVVCDVTTSAKKMVKVGGADKGAIDVTVKNLTKGNTAVFTCCCESGMVFSAKFEGAPFSVRMITADELKAWQDGPGK